LQVDSVECGLDSTSASIDRHDLSQPYRLTLLQLPSIDWIDFGSICFCSCLFFRYDMLCCSKYWI